MSGGGREPAARVAVIVPCYNDGATVGETVASIDEAEPVELVVVDDASTDPATAKELERLEADGIRVVRHPHNLGLVGARTTGLRETRAPYVFPLDADDCAAPGALGAMADVLDAHPQVGVCYGDYEEFGRGSVVRAVPERLDPYRLGYTNEYPVSSLFRRRALDAVDGWSVPPALESYEDWNLWLKLVERGELGVHLGPSRITYRRRLQADGGRMLDVSKTRHPQIYRELRAAHPRLFASVREHRRRSDLSPVRKLLYPVVYGGRRRFGIERRLKRLLDRAGLWTLRR